VLLLAFSAVSIRHPMPAFYEAHSLFDAISPCSKLRRAHLSVELETTTDIAQQKNRLGR
jgi:hypothetical protein